MEYYSDLLGDVMPVKICGHGRIYANIWDQIAHHGIGCYHTDLYMLCNPKIAYWPCGKEVLEYKNGSRFKRPHIKYLVDTTEQMIYQPDGNHTFCFKTK